MAMGTWDMLYTVRLSDGSLVQMTSGQYARYKFFHKKILPVLWVLFTPIRKIYQWRNKIKEVNHAV